MSFFRQFPTTTYDLQKTGALTRVVDLFRNVTSPQLKLDPTIAYTTYRIQNGDRPDVVSEKLYGDPDYYWTFFIINDHLKAGHTSWPMSDYQMETYLTREYDSYSVIQMADYTDSILPHIVTINSVSCGTVVADESFGIDFSSTTISQNVLNASTYITRPIMKYDPYMQQLWVTKTDSADTFISTLDNSVPAGTFRLSLYTSSGTSVTASSITIGGSTVVYDFLPAAATLSNKTISSPGILPYIPAGRDAIHHFVFAPQLGDAVQFGTYIKDIDSASPLYQLDIFNGIGSSAGSTGTVTAPSRVTALIPALSNAYGGIEVNGNQYYYFTDPQGFVVTGQDVYRSLMTDPSTVIAPSNRIIGVTYADYENSLNEQRSSIRVVNPAYIQAFVKQYRDLINA